MICRNNDVLFYIIIAVLLQEQSMLVTSPTQFTVAYAPLSTCPPLISKLLQVKPPHVLITQDVATLLFFASREILRAWRVPSMLFPLSLECLQLFLYLAYSKEEITPSSLTISTEEPRDIWEKFLDHKQESSGRWLISVISKKLKQPWKRIPNWYGSNLQLTPLSSAPTLLVFPRSARRRAPCSYSTILLCPQFCR